MSGDQLMYAGMMLGAYAAMGQADRDELHAWEREHLDGATPTSAWPGWQRYLPGAPTPQPTYRKRPIPGALRRAVLDRDEHECRACGARRDLSVDHVVPEVAGGPATLDNLQTLCRTCNSAKGARHG